MAKQVAEDHGFTPFELLDENGSMTLKVSNYRVISENYVGAGMANYDFMLVLSHFKGHAMAGFGGAIKNISIGLGSAEGKAWIHSGGTSKSNIWGGDQTAFTESMAEAASTVQEYYGDRIIYINVMNRLSVDCDCDGNPAEPDIHDIGILASHDPVALDQACVDLVYQAEGNASLVKRIESRNGIHTLEHAEEIGIGSRTYEMVDIEEGTLTSSLEPLKAAGLPPIGDRGAEMSDVWNVLNREFVYLWYYFDIQLRQIFWYWVIGMAIGSLISVFAKDKIHGLFSRMQGKKLGLLGIIPACLLGIASPLCMYGTIPIAASFRKHGMREDWLAAFMMASILLNPQLIIYSAALGVTALTVRIVTCFICGCAAGLFVFLFYRDKEFFNFDGFEERASRDTHPNLLIRYLLNLWRNIKATGLYFLFGILLSALFQRYVSQDVMVDVFGGNEA